MAMSLENRRAFVMGVALAAGAAAVVIAACSGTPRPRNLLFITLDTMRADRLPSYGFSGVDTPALDRIAAEGAVFEQAFASVPLTLPSHASLFTGLYPHRLNLRDNVATPLAPEFTTMAEALRDRGLMTGAFVASGVLGPSRGLDQGFVVYNDAVAAGCSSAPRARRPANEVVDEALKWIAEQPTAFFAWVHLYDTHRPYQLPSDYQGRYDNPYLEAIAFEDAQISRLIAHLEGAADPRRHADRGDRRSRGVPRRPWRGLARHLHLSGGSARSAHRSRTGNPPATHRCRDTAGRPDADRSRVVRGGDPGDRRRQPDQLFQSGRRRRQPRGVRGVPVLTEIRLVRPPVPSRRSIQGHRSAASGVVPTSIPIPSRNGTSSSRSPRLALPCSNACARSAGRADRRSHIGRASIAQPRNASGRLAMSAAAPSHRGSCPRTTRIRRITSRPSTR